MEKKSFIVILVILVFTFLATTAIKYFRIAGNISISIDKMPMEKEGWVGTQQSLAPEIVEMLGASQLFSAKYVNLEGKSIQLFVDYFSPDNTSGAIHSPRNCLPGSGWAIINSIPRAIHVGNIRFLHRD